MEYFHVFLLWKQKYNLIFILRNILSKTFLVLPPLQEKQLFHFSITTAENYIIQSMAGVHQGTEVQMHKLQHKDVCKYRGTHNLTYLYTTSTFLGK